MTVISRASQPNVVPSEPSSLLIRRKGGNIVDADEFAMNTETSRMLIAYEMGRRGLGPKLYGLFKGGSIEEYIHSHTLTYEESTVAEISRDVALSLAKVHAIKGLPITSKASDDMKKRMREWIKMIPGKKSYWKNHDEIQKMNLDLDFILNFDFEQQVDWLDEKCSRVKMRKHFILFDMNYLNCLVRNHPKDGESKVVLIDYDLAHHDSRGMDFGSHFINRRFQADSKVNKIIPNSRFFTVEEKRNFLKIYQQEIKRLNVWNDFDEDGIDSVENLLLESRIGECIHNLFFGCYIMSKPEFLNVEPLFASLLEFFLKSFSTFKEEIDVVTK